MTGTLFTLYIDEQKTLYIDEQKTPQKQEVVYKEDNETDTKRKAVAIILFSSLFLGAYSSFRHIDGYGN